MGGNKTAVSRRLSFILRKPQKMVTFSNYSIFHQNSLRNIQLHLIAYNLREISADPTFLQQGSPLKYPQFPICYSHVLVPDSLKYLNSQNMFLRQDYVISFLIEELFVNSLSPTNSNSSSSVSLIGNIYTQR
ncbi:Hypothetical_protein [Hexamita inflata]|uniref:Hypothetical_protein n=1 Tax=Hexamita inflata TaxID=28002 RepID=A0AA86UET5_9EUKA|nr:Hypothetical protein HINF_LOCUS25923 [Hexamita inflata]